jgi:DNA-binding Lrp family transcriptional regulator
VSFIWFPPLTAASARPGVIYQGLRHVPRTILTDMIRILRHTPDFPGLRAPIHDTCCAIWRNTFIDARRGACRTLDAVRADRIPLPGDLACGPREMIDAIDRQLLDLLRGNPHISNKAMAQALGVSDTTVGVRLERLSSKNIARVIAQRDVRALGWRISGQCDVFLKDVDPEEVLSRIHAHANVITIYRLAGPPELTIRLAARDLEELTHVALEVVGSDPDVRRVDLQIFTGHGHVRAGFGNLESPRHEGPAPEGDLQSQIMEILSRDGRISNREISRMLGIAEATVRARIRAMQQKGLLRYILVCNPERVGYNALVFMRLRLPPPLIPQFMADTLHNPNIFGCTGLTGEHNLGLAIYAHDWPHAWELCSQLSQWSPHVEDPIIRPAISFARHRYDLAFISSVGE